jgi:putative heme iron utilization protein
MKEDSLVRAAALVLDRNVAALCTLHQGAPGISLVPYALVAEPLGFLVLVSALSSHTQDMQADPRVALLIAEPESPGASAHALARVAVSATAAPIPREDLRYAAAKASYAARFPDMAMLFDLGDFMLFALLPTAIRVITGFAQAHSTTPATFARVLQERRSAT